MNTQGLKKVRNGWRLDSILTVSVGPARFFKGKLPYFEPSVMEGKSVVTPGGWRGGDAWQSHTTPGPWGLPGVI
jgi:hypothetical protein